MSSSASTQISQGAAVAQAVQLAGRELIRQQRDHGFWSAELTADSTLESDYILLQLWMHPPQGKTWNPPTRERIDKAVASIFARQLPDGGFNIYVKGPSEISATVKAYFSLKVAGVTVDDHA